MDVLLEVIKAYGIYAGVAVYLIYSTRKDYQGACKRINTLEDFINTKLMSACERVTTAVENNSKVLEEHQKAMKTCEWQKER